MWVDLGVLVNMPGKRVLVWVAELPGSLVGVAKFVGKAVFVAKGMFVFSVVVVGWGMAVERSGGLGMLVGAAVRVESRGTVVLGGGPVCDGRKVARAASWVVWAPCIGGGVQVEGRLFRVGVLVGMPSVGMMVGGGRGLKATCGLMKICVKTISRPTALINARTVKMSQIVSFFMIPSSFILLSQAFYQ